MRSAFGIEHPGAIAKRDTRKDVAAVTAGATAGVAGKSAVDAVQNRRRVSRLRRFGGMVASEAPRLRIVKAFDAEAQRHARQKVYEGGAAGGAVVAGASSVRLAGRSAQASSAARLERKWSATAHGAAQLRLNRMAQPEGEPKTGSNIASVARLHRKGIDHSTEAVKLSRKAKVAGHGSKVAAITAAGLAGASYATSRHDRKGGRSYSYR